MEKMMSPKEKKKTEEKIIDVAEEIFVKDGFNGTRMQTIADKAGINKALLHYYYRSKQKLFYVVFSRLAPKFFNPILGIIGEDIPFFEKIEKFIDRYINEILKKNQHLPLFIISELERNSDEIVEVMLNAFDSLGFYPLDVFEKDVKREIETGNIKPIDHKQLFINIISMAIFPFIGKAIIMKLSRFSEEEYADFIQERKKLVAEFVINSIKIDK